MMLSARLRLRSKLLEFIVLLFYCIAFLPSNMGGTVKPASEDNGDTGKSEGTATISLKVGMPKLGANGTEGNGTEISGRYYPGYPGVPVVAAPRPPGLVNAIIDAVIGR